jgi:hypothetical protein
MNPRSTAILALVVAALGAFLYFYEIRGQEERAEAEEAAKRVFPGIAADQIDAIALVASGGQWVRLERDEERWRIAEPVRFPADAIRADSLASSLASLSSEAVFEEPEPLEEYGLGPDPSVRLWVGDVEHTLHVGDKTPVGGNTYVKTGAGAQVYAVKSYRASSLSRSLQELRDSKVLDFDRDAIDRIEANWPGGGVVLEKGEAGWTLVEPLETPADADTVDGLLSDLGFLRADGFIDEVPPDAEVGLDAPAFEVALVAGGGEEGATPTRVRIAIGATTQGGQRAVRGSVENALYQIGEQRLEDFPRTVAAYRFKDLADFEVADADRFEVVFPAASPGEASVVTGERSEVGWTTTPESMEAGKAAQMIESLSKLTAIDIVADAMGEGELRGMELLPPAVTFRAFSEEEGGETELLAEIQLGKADSERGIAARRSGDEVVYRLEYDLAERIPISREAFVNRFLSSEEPQDSEEEESDAEEE